MINEPGPGWRHCRGSVRKLSEEITRKLNVPVAGVSCRREKGELTVTQRKEKEKEEEEADEEERAVEVGWWWGVVSLSRQGENHKWSFLYQRRILRQGRGTAISLALGSWINRPVLLGNVSRQRSLRENISPLSFRRICPGSRRPRGSRRCCLAAGVFSQY